MFILSNRIWGPIAGVATALLFVFILGTYSEPSQPVAPAAAAQVATNAFDTNR